MVTGRPRGPGAAAPAGAGGYRSDAESRSFQLHGTICGRRRLRWPSDARPGPCQPRNDRAERPRIDGVDHAAAVDHGVPAADEAGILEQAELAAGGRTTQAEFLGDDRRPHRLGGQQRHDPSARGICEELDPGPIPLRHVDSVGATALQALVDRSALARHCRPRTVRRAGRRSRGRVDSTAGHRLSTGRSACLERPRFGQTARHPRTGGCRPRTVRRTGCRPRTVRRAGRRSRGRFDSTAGHRLSTGRSACLERPRFGQTARHPRTGGWSPARLGSEHRTIWGVTAPPGRPMIRSRGRRVRPTPGRG